MSENNKPKQNTQEEEAIQESTGKVIDESQYKVHMPKEKAPTAIGRGGDPLFRRIQATKEQLLELMEETQTVQDWVQRETCNNVAISCLNDANLKEIYFEIKDGFGEYGKISLMGFKTPSGVEIPRLKIYDKNGDVIQVLTGPMAMDELNKRALAYSESMNTYEKVVEQNENNEDAVAIADYSGNPDDYIT